MIPILYRSDERSFTSNGIGRLADCISCIVTEERNGIYELEFEYPITGKLYDEMITNGGIVAVIHDDHHDIQRFDLYAHTDPINGIVKFYAHHISYRLNQIILKPFSGTSVGDTLTKIPMNAMNACPFTFWTDKATVANFNLTHPANIREILGGTSGSILDTFGGGDYQFNNMEVRLYSDKGNDTGVTIRYGKNMVTIENNYDDSESYSAIVPFWVGADGEVVYGGMVVSPTLMAKRIPWTNEQMIDIEDGNGEVIEFNAPIITPKAVDFSSKFEETPSAADLENAAAQFFRSYRPWLPRQNIKVDFVQLWQTPEYENVASLQRVGLCDYVSVYFPEMGIVANSQKVVKVVYNVLLERYDEMELGMAKTTFSGMLSEMQESLTTKIEDLIAQTQNNIANAVQDESNVLKALMERQTELITGGLGGHVVMNLNADGEPQEILIMDTDDIATAIHVIRMNQNGIGFSQNGYAGPYSSAWTIDGVFNADFIGSGTILANYIRGGTLTVGGVSNNYGQINVIDKDGNTVGTWTNDGITTGSFRADFDGGYLLANEEGLTILTGNVQQYPTYIRFVTDYGVEITKQSASELRQSIMPPGELSINNYIYNPAGSTYSFNVSHDTSNGYHCRISGGLYLDTLSVTGTKSRAVKTEEYGSRLLFCYETPTPMFGDVGEGVIDDSGVCYVFLDPVFAETIALTQYQVFLQKYGQGECWVSERNAGYFVVRGDIGLSFGWELKAKQRNYDQMRLDEDVSRDIEKIDYGEEGSGFYIDLIERRIAS